MKNVLANCLITETVSNEFRPWHADTLLMQATTLAENCLREFAELRALERLDEELKIRVKVEQYSIDAEDRRLNDTNWESLVAQAINAFIASSEGSFQSSVEHSVQLYEHTKTGVFSEHISAGRGVNEKYVQAGSRNLEKSLADIKQKQSDAERTLSEKRLIDLKSALTLTTNQLDQKEGPFFLDNRIKNLENRIRNTYCETIERAKAAEIGLKLVYGYEEDLPAGNDGDEDELIISTLVIWLRKANSWLAAYSMRDQGFVRVVSLKEQIDKNDWEELIKGNFAKLTFSLPDGLFDSHWNVRLRGISACTIGNNADYPWAVEVNVPQTAQFITQTRIRKVKQALPGVYIGRVDPRSVYRSPDVCGVVSILNASPIASEGHKWSLCVNPTCVSEQKKPTFSDIILEFVCVGVTKQVISLKAV